MYSVFFGVLLGSEGILRTSGRGERALLSAGLVVMAHFLFIS